LRLFVSKSGTPVDRNVLHSSMAKVENMEDPEKEPVAE
jgi:hypothetical protein